MERPIATSKTTLSDLDNMIREAMLRIDDLSKVPASTIIQEMVTVNLATFTYIVELIRKLVFGPNKDTERIQNFVIKIDTLLDINGFYKVFVTNFETFSTGSFFKLHSEESKFIIKYSYRSIFRHGRK